DPDSPADREKLYPVADAIHSLALSLGGTISAQHGVGLARTPWVEKQAGPLIPVYRELKRIFDPTGVLNPGKIVGPDPSRPAWPLREVVGVQWPVASGNSGTFSDASQKRPKPALTVLTSEALVGELAKCNGCGECRPRVGPVRMCPVFRAKGDEAATPRAKVNLLRDLLTGDAPFSGDDVS